MEPRKHSIIIIKNLKGEYLQVFDYRWNSYLFLNTKIKEEKTEENIKNEVLNRFGELKKIQVTFLMDKIHTKFSESAKMEKTYHHYFYLVSIPTFPKKMRAKEFKINDITYRWFSQEELELNERIMKVNSDIVGYIKDFFRKQN